MSQFQISKSKTWLACTASAALIIAISTQAFAEKPQTAATLNASFIQLNARLDRLSKAELDKLLILRNAKGERKFVKEVDPSLPKLWSTLDAKTDGIEGTSTEAAYNLFRISRKANEVIVAVIDSGVDISHEDLAGKIWVNRNEIPGNGIDDDHNGYVDDINGWNYLGNSRGENVGANTLEVTREYVRMKKKAEAGSLSAEDATYYEEVKSLYQEKQTSSAEQTSVMTSFLDAFRTLKSAGLTEETVQAVTAFNATTPVLQSAKRVALRSLGYNLDTPALISAIEGAAINYSLTFESSTLVGDNPSELEKLEIDPATRQAVGNKKMYGNPNVTGPDASHGTHVSGIIAAIRNKSGIDGQASNVKIMSLRAVPDGDERDKDIANAIYYAVNHGARVINMSFGKALSPQKNWVDDAMKYAETAGVLLVHAAGNDGKNTESFNNNFPHAKIGNAAGRKITTWIEVGASDAKVAPWLDAEFERRDLAADFSNWGKTSIDLFAPGKQILSTVPGNKYAAFNGTSMASPEVAGVAALLLNKFPHATGIEIRNAIMKTVTTYDDSVQILRSITDAGGSTSVAEVPFNSVSETGGIINANRAMKKLANDFSKSK